MISLLKWSQWTARASAEYFPGGGATVKTRPKNRTIKPPSTLSVSCMKIQGEPRPPSANAHGRQQ